MIRHPAHRLLILLVLLVGFGACQDGGCGNKAAKIPATPIARVEQMTSKLPTATDTVVVVGDLEAMRNSLNLIKTRLPETGVVETLQKQIQVAFGIDLLDAESWKRSGLAPNTSAVGALYRSRVILMLYVENRQMFEKTLVEKSKAAFEIEAVTKSQKVGKHQMKVLSEDAARQIAWLYQGKLAIVSMPAIDGRESLNDGSATLVLAEIADSKKEASLWADKGFQDFRKALIDKYPVAAYVNPKSGLNSDAAKAEIEKDPNAKAAAAWAEKNVTFLGAGLVAEGNQAKLRAYVGLTPEMLKLAEEAKKLDVKHDWDAFTTEKLMLGARLSVNFEKLYSLVMSTAPEEQQRGVRRDMKMIGDRIGLDLEKDVLTQLAGHVGVFFYGVAGNPMMLAAGLKNPVDLSNALGMMMVLKFKSAEAVDTVVAKLVTTAGGAVTVRPFLNVSDDPSFKVVALPQPSFGNFFIHGDTVAFATLAFGDEAMHKYLTDKRDDKKLSAMEGLELGKEFSKAEAYNGLYFYSKRAQDNLGSMLAMGGVGQILASIQEVSLSLDTDPQGAFGLLTLDLVPAPKAEAPAAGDTQDKPK